MSGSTDLTIKVWDLDIQQSWSSIACRVTMVGHGDTVRCVKMDSSRELVISGSYDTTLKVRGRKHQKALAFHHCCAFTIGIRRCNLPITEL